MVVFAFYEHTRLHYQITYMKILLSCKLHNIIPTTMCFTYIMSKFLYIQTKKGSNVMDKYTLKMIMFYLWINFNNVATDLEIRDGKIHRKNNYFTK